MRRIRFAAAASCLALILSACGSDAVPEREGTPSGDTPAAADLAADALEALAETDSAHYVLDARLDVDPGSSETGARTGFAGGPITLHVEGDGSSERGTADVVVDFGEESLAATILADEESLFVKFMGTWYGDAHIEIDKDARERELVTPARVRGYFDDVFTGEVTEGPEIGGRPTWKFDGSLNVDGLIDLVQDYQGDLHETELAQLKAFGEVTRLSFLVGRDDGLPHRYEMDVDLTHNRAESLDEDPPVESLTLDLTVELSEFGEPVSFGKPKSYAPLDKLLEAFFGGSNDRGVVRLRSRR